MTPKRGLMRPHHEKLALIYRILDIFLIIGSLLFCAWAFEISWSSDYDTAAVLSGVLMVLFSSNSDLYRSWRVAGLVKELLELYTTWVKVIVALLLLAFVFKVTDTYSRLAISSWFLMAPILMSILRLIVRNIAYSLRQNGWNSRNVAIIGANPQGIKFSKGLQRASWMGLTLVGFFDDREIDRIDTLGIDCLSGDLDDVVEKAKNGEIDIIYITMPLKAEERTRELIMRLADTTVSLYYVPDFYSLDILHGRIVSVGDSPVISIFENPHNGVDGWLKRVEDIFIASAVLLVMLIPILAIGLGVKLSSPGPIIYRQKRYGINGQQISVWKFRTMFVSENDAFRQASMNDSRVTDFGLFLRRTSLDELPQFINVLMGDMSIVGPRPHAVAHNEQYRNRIHRYMLRHKVKPGITGWAQINGWRGETDTLEKMEKRIEYDLEYIRNWSLLLDIRIFLLTFVKGFASKNAY